MTAFQRLIKLIANAIAIGLIVAIIGGAATLMLTITGVKTLKDEIQDVKDNEKFTLYSVEAGTDNISIELMTASLSIKIGDEFSVYYGEGFRVNSKKGTLKIEDTVKNLNLARSHDVVVTLPKSASLGKVNITSGTGSIYIERLVCDRIELDLGVGTTEIDYIKAKTHSEIDCGVGALTVEKGLLNNLDYSAGVGKSDITAKITGVSDIEAGIGEIKLSLTGGSDIYTVKGETGIGVIRVGKENLSDNKVIGSGKNVVTIEGGIGSVRVNFAD